MPADGETLLTLLEWAASHPNIGVGLLDRNESRRWLSWRELGERARAVAGGLQALGLEPAQSVALFYPTGFEFIAAFFGALAAGAVPVPFYPPARLGRLDEYHARTAAMLSAARARIVLADGRVRRVLGPAVAAASLADRCPTLDELPARAATAVPVAPGDLGLVQFSSGTTVDPKPVALSHRALVAQARLINAHWPDRPGYPHSGVSWLPLYHDMGLIGSLFLAIERPGPLTLIPPEAFITRPAIWLRAIARERATLSVAPSFAFALCTRKVRGEELEGADLSCWEVAVNGAETVVPEVARAFAERFARWGFRAQAMTPVYGLSEAALAVTFSDPWTAMRSRTFDRGALAAGRAVAAAEGRELASLGRPLPGFEVAIVGDAGESLGERAVGRIKVRGPSLMEGYLGRPEPTAAALAGGWLDTGDRGFLCEGDLYLTGRDKEILIVNGQNWAPEELERAAETAPGVRPGCVVAASWLANGEATESVLLLVEASRECTPQQRAALPERCRAAVLAATGIEPAQVVVLAPGTLPRTSSGKLRRREALRAHLAGELHAPKPVTPALVAGAMARSAFAFLRARLRPREELTRSQGDSPPGEAQGERPASPAFARGARGGTAEEGRAGAASPPAEGDRVKPANSLRGRGEGEGPPLKEVDGGGEHDR